MKTFLSILTHLRLKTRGFSLVELLIVISIIGILSAISIPSYNKYRTTATLKALNTDGTSLAQAFQICMSLNDGFSDCDTLDEIDVSCSTCKSPLVKKDPKLCVNLENTVGNDSFKACVSTDNNKWAMTLNSPSGKYFCYKETGSMTSGTNPTCDTTTTNTQYDEGCDKIHQPITECTRSSDCGGSVGADYCKKAKGECGTSGSSKAECT